MKTWIVFVGSSNFKYALVVVLQSVDRQHVLTLPRRNYLSTWARSLTTFTSICVNLYFRIEIEIVEDSKDCMTIFNSFWDNVVVTNVLHDLFQKQNA